MGAHEIDCNMAALPEGGVIDPEQNQNQSTYCTVTHGRCPVHKVMLDCLTLTEGKVVSLFPLLPTSACIIYRRFSGFTVSSSNSVGMMQRI